MDNPLTVKTFKSKENGVDTVYYQTVKTDNDGKPLGIFDLESGKNLTNKYFCPEFDALFKSVINNIN